MNRKHTTLVRDTLLIITLLLIGIILLFVLRGQSNEGSYVIIMYQNEEKARFSLASDGIYNINNGKNKIEILGGKVRMTYADCPDELCIRQGWIEFDGQSIICLPNKITVMVSGGDSLVDFVL
ncbi:MAG: NusG domain II-containing protein [Spirochaetales bacterium]|nr:NusG domain II-containing protein [Spirochaetales bacterium]